VWNQVQLFPSFLSLFWPHVCRRRSCSLSARTCLSRRT
jgi:hypothetical protein